MFDFIKKLLGKTEVKRTPTRATVGAPAAFINWEMRKAYDNGNRPVTKETCEAIMREAENRYPGAKVSMSLANPFMVTFEVVLEGTNERTSVDCFIDVYSNPNKGKWV